MQICEYEQPIRVDALICSNYCYRYLKVATGKFT